MSDKCECSFRIRMVGDGCRHCQPQTYIETLERCIDDDRAEIEKLEALIAELRKDAWRPIETAPKDDTEILVGGIFDDWNGASWHVTVSQYLDRSDRRGHRHRNGARWATHWMPLPSAPDTSTQEVG